MKNIRVASAIFVSALGGLGCSGGGVVGTHDAPPGPEGPDALDAVAPEDGGFRLDAEPEIAGLDLRDAEERTESSRCTLERCNGVDDDCDGVIDPPGSFGCQFLFEDRDADGYGSLAPAVCVCAAVYPYTAAVSGDCDDSDATVNPSTTEVCNARDDNCNGVVDEWALGTCYRDADGDGWGSLETLEACGCPPGYVERSGDCNDFNAAIHPGAEEVCNARDDDCDGETDEGLPTLLAYLDGDGDGFAAANAPAIEACAVPFGFTTPRDRDGDGVWDWDCDDSDISVYPGAPDPCDGKDNDCDGRPDRLCFRPCDGDWPFRLPFAQGNFAAQPVDLDGDGDSEVIVQDHLGFAILDHRAQVLYESSSPVPNYSRAPAVVADLDQYDQFGPETQTLEVLTGNGGRPRFYRLEPDRRVTVFEGTTAVFDASRFLAADVDRDGPVEFFAGTWCTKDAAVQVFRFDRATGEIRLVRSIADPDGRCEYGDGRFLGDLDADGVLDLVLGNGFAKATDPSSWGGRIHAMRFTDPATLAVEALCAPGACFPTDLDGLHPGAVSDLIRFPDRVLAAMHYYETAEAGAANPDRWFLLQFDLAGAFVTSEEFTVPPGIGYPTDVDDDGVEESDGRVATVGLWDLDADGVPEKVAADGNALLVSRWSAEARAFVADPLTRFKVSTSDIEVRAVADLDSDGRADVLAADADGRVFCLALGADTWNPVTSLPPHLPWYLRTNQWDPYEPDDGEDLDGDGLPDRVTRVASALTRKGAFYGYLSRPDDADYFLVNTGWNGAVCLQAPPRRNYLLEVYSFADKWTNDTHAPTADGRPDGLVWSTATGPGAKVCFHGTSVVPYRTNEYRFVVGIRSVEGFSAHRPYWLSAPK